MNLLGVMLRPVMTGLLFKIVMASIAPLSGVRHCATKICSFVTPEKTVTDRTSGAHWLEGPPNWFTGNAQTVYVPGASTISASANGCMLPPPSGSRFAGSGKPSRGAVLSATGTDDVQDCPSGTTM